VSQDQYVEFKVEEKLLEDVVKIIQEVKPPSKIRWLVMFFLMGAMGGLGIGIVLG
jgi:hypothetical protein